MTNQLSSIFFIGMPGSGKSTLGRLVARACNLQFIDLDREIEARAGVPVATIFEVEGEPSFRRREASLLDELTQRHGIVLATGGGAILQTESRERLHQRGFVVYLSSSVDELVRRTQHDKARPLLQGVDLRQRLTGLMEARAPLYESIAHLTVQSGPGNARKLVKRIVDAATASQL